MVRSMYSGVSGMKAHQARMDVIGNNISNVNTYGFKGSRATFRDVYYQTLKNASGATANAGGGNPSQVGYGAQLSSVDILMGGSSFTMTDNAMDLGIDGEGFFQVQDQDGNKFYTRAGQLRFDSAGNLVDSQRNFVLGVSGNPLGKPAGSEKITIQVPPVSPTVAKSEDTLNEVVMTITSNNTSKDANVGLTIVPGSKMTDGVRAVAEVTTGGITVKLNPNERFTSEADLSKAINDAINKTTMATNGKDHPSGGFNIAFDPKEAFPTAGLTGEQICSTDYAIQAGKVTGWPTETVWGGFKPTGKTGDAFTGGTITPPATTSKLDAFTCVYDTDAGSTSPKPFWKVTATIGGVAYTANVTEDQASAGKFNLKNAAGNSEDYIEFDRPNYQTLTDLGTTITPGPPPVPNPPANGHSLAPIPELTTALATMTASAAEKSKALGLAQKTFSLSGGTIGGSQDVSNLTGISIGPDGVITAGHAVHGDIVVGRIDIATFANPQGLLQVGGSYFGSTPNSGKVTIAPAGSEGAGALATGSLELSNVDLSREFSDMITTQRGFQANSRMITVSDTMLEELVNLKR